MTPDKEALGILVNHVLSYLVGEDEEARFLRSLLERYALDRPVLAQPRLGDWRGRESSASVLEKIVGEDTLRPIAMLEQALSAAESVVHIEGPLGLGTGFVVAPRLIMTNHHVIDSAAHAMNSVVTFNYQLDALAKPKAYTRVLPQTGGIFFTDAELDVTIVEIEKAPEAAIPLPVRPARMAVDSRVAIIQHPDGFWKKISLQNNFVEYADERVVQYTTSTRRGSSGAPVFDDDFQVVAVHHAGGDLPDPTTQQVYLRNEGVSMMAVVRALQANAPHIYSQLTIA